MIKEARMKTVQRFGMWCVAVWAAGLLCPAFALNPIPIPAVTAVSPTSGPLAGGTSVTITGRAFSLATEVDFGATAATSFTKHNVLIHCA